MGKNNGVSPHGCRIKKERCFVLLSFSNAQVFWQTAQSGCVCVCVRACVLIRSPLLFSSELPLITETYCVIKKQTHQNRECLQSCEKCSLGIWWLLCCSGSCGKKAERWQECSTVGLKEIKGRLYHRNALYHGCPYVTAAGTQNIFCRFKMQHVLDIYIWCDCLVQVQTLQTVAESTPTEKYCRSALNLKYFLLFLTFLVQTEIPQQLLDGSPWSCVQTPEHEVYWLWWTPDFSSCATIRFDFLIFLVKSLDNSWIECHEIWHRCCKDESYWLWWPLTFPTDFGDASWRFVLHVNSNWKVCHDIW